MFDLSLLSDLEINVIVGAASAVAGAFFGPKIKDWLKGIPSDVRTALNDAETDVATKLKAGNAAAKTAILSTLPKLPAKKTALPAASIPAAPAPSAAAIFVAAATEPAAAAAAASAAAAPAA